MNALRRGRIYLYYNVLIDLLCHERNHRCCRLADRHECSIKRHVSVDLIRLHAFRPETLTASSDIPVTHIIDELFKCTCSLRDPVITQIVIYGLDHGIHLGE